MLERTNEISEIEAVIAATELADVLGECKARINQELSAVSLSPTTIYCSKTGAPIGSLSREVLSDALAFHGREKFGEYLMCSNHLGIDPKWIVTDETALDRLIEIDPKGYAVYCLNLLTGHYAQRIHPNERDVAKRTAHHWALARAWQWVNLLSKPLLDDLCDNLCGVMCYAPTVLRYIAQTIGKSKTRLPDALARLAVDGRLTKILRDATDSALASLGKYNEELGRKIFTPAEMAEGPTNIRFQKHSKNRIEIDQDILAFAVAFDKEHGYDIERIINPRCNVPPKRAVSLFSKLQANTATGAKPEEQVTITDEMLTALGDFDLSETDDFSDENTVEIRRIPSALLPQTERRAPLVHNAPVILPPEEKASIITPENARAKIMASITKQEPKVSAFAAKLKAKILGGGKS